MADPNSLETTTEILGQGYSYGSQFVNMLLTLSLIIGLIFLSIFILKRLMRSRIQHLNKSTGIKILERRALNSKTSLYIIDILGKGVVIAESPAGIDVVTEFSSEVNLIEKLEELNATSPSFKESFTKKLRKMATKQT